MIAYQDDRVTLYHADCRDVLPSLDAGCVDLLLTDAPYGVSTGIAPDAFRSSTGRSVDFFDTDHDPVAVLELLGAVHCLTMPLMSPTASAYWWLGHRHLSHIANLYEYTGWTTKPMAWMKPDAPPAMPDAGWSSALELCCHAYRPGRTWNHRLAAPRNAFVEPVVRDTMRHPTQKPLKIMEALITASSNLGDMVLDPFAGSGTTLVAARALGRRAIGIEVEKRFSAMAVMRLSQGVLW